MSGHESDADFLRSVADACDGMANDDPADTSGHRLRSIAGTNEILRHTLERIAFALRDQGHPIGDIVLDAEYIANAACRAIAEASIP